MNNIDHPCKETCSGWKQGYEAGVAASAEQVSRLTDDKNEALRRREELKSDLHVLNNEKLLLAEQVQKLTADLASERAASQTLLQSPTVSELREQVRELKDQVNHAQEVNLADLRRHQAEVSKAQENERAFWIAKFQHWVKCAASAPQHIQYIKAQGFNDCTLAMMANDRWLPPEALANVPERSIIPKEES